MPHLEFQARIFHTLQLKKDCYKMFIKARIPIDKTFII